MVDLCRFPKPARTFACGAVLLLASTALAAAPPAFPGAEGFGAGATGGRGGDVVHVTCLDDAGPGSFREAVAQPGRIVVFDVGGIVRLQSQVATASNVTVLGQTAPGDGLTLSGQGLSASHSSNVIVRYLRVRSSITAGRGTKALNATDASNLIFDHLSVSWGRWDDLGITGSSHDLTLQDSIISEAIDPQRFGALIDSVSNVTIARNLWADNQSRNPKGKGNLQYVNNVVYNWGGSGYCGGHSGAVWKQDLINNCFIAGPSSSDKGALAQFTANDHIFQAGNLLDLDRDGRVAGRAVAPEDFRGTKADEAPTFVDGPSNHPAVAVTVLSAADACEKVLAGSGCSLRRDSVDKRVIEQVRSFGRAGAIIRDEAAVGGVGQLASGAPIRDADRDGIADEWETAHGLDPHDPADAAKIDPATGYANVELYANSLAR